MYNLTDKKSKLLTQAAKKYDLELVLLFGSMVSGKIHKHSDFDIAFLSSKKMDLMDEARLITELFPVFDSYKIDVVNLKKASPLLMEQIFSNHKVLFCSDMNIYNTYSIYSFRRYIEAKPLFELRGELISKYFAKKYA